LSAEFLENGVVMCSSSSTSTASCGSAQATGSLTAGTLGVDAEFPANGLPAPNFSGETSVEALANAALLYDFTSNVSSGTAVFTFTVEGTTFFSKTSEPFGMNQTTCASVPCFAIASIGIASNESFVGTAAGSDNYQLNVSSDGGPVSGQAPIQIVVPIVNGTAELAVNLNAFASCEDLSAAARAKGASCVAIADYFDPLAITAASVYDANGNLVSDATLVSQSGYSPAAATPEPSSILLLGTGLPLFGLVSRRWRDRKSRGSKLRNSA
jgi:hypothetical protein